MTTTPDKAWHHLPHEDIARHLDTSLAHGLTAAEAANRLERHGPDALPEGASRLRTPCSTP